MKAYQAKHNQDKYQSKYQNNFQEDVLMKEKVVLAYSGGLDTTAIIPWLKETYGYEITHQLNALGFDDVVEGTVYTILLRLEKNKLVNIQKKKSELGPPRKFYSLNEAGREELKIFWKKWAFLESKINQLKENK